MSNALPTRLIVADQVLYESFVRSGLDVSDLERIEKTEGQVMAIPTIAEKVQRSLEKNADLDPSIVAGWKQKVRIDSKKFSDYFQAYSPNSDRTRAEIEQYVDNFARAIRMLDVGASQDDCEVLGYAIWIGSNSSSQVCIATDDRDLLGAGHLIVSYLGIRVNIRSIFEILKCADMSDALQKYCPYNEIGQDISYRAGDKVDAKVLHEYMGDLARKAKLAVHPSLSRGAHIKSVIRQS